MLQYILGWFNLHWTRSSPLYHPLSHGITRSFIPTPLGDLELLISPPTTHPPTHNPILFIHGGFGHASVWQEWQTYLHQHNYSATTYAISVRNHGASFVLPKWSRMVFSTTFSDIASDVLSAISEIQSREGVRPILVCHSAGAALAQYLLAHDLTKTPALVLAGAVPHYGFMAPLYNWWTRIDWWIFLRGIFMLQHSRSALCTTTLVRNAFFGPDYPWEKVKEFERWMAPYESLRWPAETIGTWRNGRNEWLDAMAIVSNITSSITANNGGKRGDKVMIILGGEDKMMQGTQERSVAEYVAAIRKLNAEREDGLEGGGTSSGVRLIEVPRAGHHLQNDVQWEDGAKALLDFVLQVPRL